MEGLKASSNNGTGKKPTEKQGKVFFASDFHLGADARLSSVERERQVIRWLDMVSSEASAIYLVGDIFEFWFEYKKAVPKGFTRLLGKLAELRDGGLSIEAFTGNHDLWMFGYFEQELGIPVHKKPIQVDISGKSFFIGHGDGLGPGDTGYKLMKKVFVHPFSQWLYRWLHPDVGIRLANFFSQTSRAATPPEERHWLGEEKEWLFQYCNRKISQGVAPDYFIFGHRHLPVDWQLANGTSRYLNLGDWMWHNSYAVFDGQDMEIRFFEHEARLISNRAILK
ncbi:MAG: UDP-2,3-diacylglucosamine diphosphatase [Saprospiraceae bacterium]